MDLNYYTLKELQELARINNISLLGSTRKIDILQLIQKEFSDKPLPESENKLLQELIKLERGESFWYVPEKCINNNRIGDIIGKGKWGNVYDFCDDEIGKCENIVKIVSLAPQMNQELIQAKYLYLDHEITANRYNDLIENAKLDQRVNHFKQEVTISRIASDLGVGPQVFDWFICDDVLQEPEGGQLISLGFIIMEKLDISLNQWLDDNELPTDMIELLYQKVEKMHQAGITHGDLHLDNIMLRLDQNNQPIDIFLIDFGYAQGSTDNKELDQGINDDLRMLDNIL